MATLALTTLGSAAGSALFPSGLSVFGATLSGAALGQAVGAIGGNYIDNALFGSSGQSRTVEGSRLTDLQVMASTEGAVIPRIYGRMRLGGQIIWATHFEEDIVTNSQSRGGGKGGFSSSSKSTTTRIDYKYYANFAVALCEGEIERIGRVWADGKELDLSNYTYRLYNGSEEQLPDGFIESKEGAGKVPAYRGIAYVLFERMPLERFGNRIPQLNFEVFRSVDAFKDKVKAVTIIPGAGEFAYDPDEITREENGTAVTENTHTRLGGSNWQVSINELQDSLPGIQSASLIVSWFGTDLRVGQCALKPGIENTEKNTSKSWSVAGEVRQTAYVVTEKDGRPAYGGTPSDAAVVAAIKDLRARGVKTTFSPFILMDIPDGNVFSDPYTSNTGQPVYPWRGRITVDPAPDRVGTPDKTSVANTQIQSFIGTAGVSDYSVVDGMVLYSGPNEWTWRRMILHYAHLCKAAGGVDAFVISSELIGLTQVRDSASNYPFVNALIQMAGDVKAVLGNETKVTYAADWSEYFGHHPDDGSGDVYFNLDPLWSCPDIDAIGVDVYWPLSDWREGLSHLDYQAGVRSIYETDYLQDNIQGGEGYDWYYQSTGDRDSQVRTDITDGYNKPWVFRYKDIYSWWVNEHYHRPGGIEDVTPTSWVPQSKPFWFTELGCPAIDKGSNQPNVFYDPKSSESACPHFSLGMRDDTMQRCYIQAFLDYYEEPANNPVSDAYSLPMVDRENIYIYTWDARPYPAFPFNSAVWGDAENWTYGHWITGRIGNAPVAQTVQKVMEDYGFSDFDSSQLYGSMQGLIIDRIMSARDVIQPLELAFFMDSFEAEGKVSFRHRGHEGVVANLTPDQLVEGDPDGVLYTYTRRQETELPSTAKISYIDSMADYRQSAINTERTTVRSERVATAQLPVVMEQEQALGMGEVWLHDVWAARETVSLALPPSQISLEPTDVVSLADKKVRLTELADGTYRTITALSIEPSIYNKIRTPARQAFYETPAVYGAPNVLLLDLPLLNEAETPAAGYVAACQSPWPGAVTFYQSSDETGFSVVTQVSAPATMGKTITDLYEGPVGRFDRGAILDVKLDYGELFSVEDLQLFGGANIAAVKNPSGGWEVLQFRDAELIAKNTYRLTNLLRGQGGTEHFRESPVFSGADFLFLDDALSSVPLSMNQIGLPLNWKVGPANRDIGHSSYIDFTHAFTGQAYKPLSPVHIIAEREDNDLVLSWTRRTRIGGDSWEFSDVPIGEDMELYEVEVLEGSEVKRTFSSNSTMIRYTEEDQIADWGAIQFAYSIKIYQISSAVGRGFPAFFVVT